MDPFSETLNELAEKTDSGDSKFGSVVTAMNDIPQTPKRATMGTGDYGGFIAMVKKVQDEARGYRDSHKRDHSRRQEARQASRRGIEGHQRPRTPGH